MIIEYISASRLDVFKTCPFRYFLQYHLGLEELKKDTIHTLKGSAVHAALEEYAKGNDSKQTLINFYADKKVWEYDNRPKGFPHPVNKNCNTCPWATRVGNDVICSIAGRDVKSFDGCPKPNFEDDFKLLNFAIEREKSPLSRKIIGAEVPFDMEIEDFRVKGFIDLITEVDETTIEVRDFKTGNRGKTTDEAFEDLQMRIYSFVAKKLYPDYKYVLMTLDYLRSKPVSVIFGEDDDNKTIAFLKSANQKIKNSIDPPRIQSFKCDWCVGYEKCGEIRKQFVKNGQFIMPPPKTYKKDGE